MGKRVMAEKPSMECIPIVPVEPAVTVEPVAVVEPAKKKAAAVKKVAKLVEKFEAVASPPQAAVASPSCELCQKSFTSKAGLAKHIRTPRHLKKLTPLA